MNRGVRIVFGGVLCLTLLAGGLVDRAAAAPDPDGAARALINWPLNTAGDLSGSIGLTGGAVLGGTGDLLAWVDDNRYSRVVLRGIFSQSFRRLGLGWSNLFTGGLEGLRAEDFERYPEPIASHLHPKNVDIRLDPFLDGLGGVYVAITDLLGQPVLFFSKATGSTYTTDAVEGWQSRVRKRYFGDEISP